MISESLTGLAIISTAAYMLADRADQRGIKAFSKLAAATAFVGLALANGAVEHRYGTVLLVALIFSWLGDAALLWRDERVFMAGLFAFLLGHLAFAVAFVVRGVQPTFLIGASIAMAIVLATAGRWFVAQAPPKLTKPVMAYVAVIAVMGALAIGTAPLRDGWLIAVAAMAFMVSDVFVGLDRFVTPGWQTRWKGTPLYFGGQVLFAWTVLRP